MKNSNDTIGNRSRDLPVCSAVPQPLRHRVPSKATQETTIYICTAGAECVGTRNVIGGKDVFCY
jgi:hypothetical protein